MRSLAISREVRRVVLPLNRIARKPAGHAGVPERRQWRGEKKLAIFIDV
jgi:hypothetical protein